MSNPERFENFIARFYGLEFEGEGRKNLSAILSRRAGENGQSEDAYLARLEIAAPGSPELRVLAQELTVTETSFFRNEDHMRAFCEVALPQAGQGPLRILSAGCSSGEEAYSLAILATQAFPGRQISIQGLDINAAVLKRAAAGRYGAWSLRQTPADIRKQYFQPDGNGFQLRTDIRAMVNFREGNLAMANAEFWRPGSFDIVFCRNVTMYFSRDAARAAIARIAASLTPGGFLFLGHAETLRGLSDDFALCHSHDTFYYRRVAVADDCADASEVHVPTKPRTEAAPMLDFHRAVELIGREDFSTVAAMLKALPPERAQESQAQLLAALVLSGSGELVEAENICARLLRHNENNAGARYLMALCRDSAGDSAAAAIHDGQAAALDSAFAMPRLHLGLLARRAGARQKARAELAAALALLEREAPVRLALFGGGFSREMLIGLCRAELERCGDAA